MPEWKFLEVRKGDKIRENVLAEFFKAASIDNAGEALVREGIQNSLDAVQDQSKPVKVRIIYGGESTAPTIGIANKFFAGLAPHLETSDFEPPAREGKIHFIAFEDFNTTGLYGDPRQWRKPDDHNPFFAYFRAEGWSQKEDGAGRWGVGKFAFPSASRFRAHFGLTIPCDDGTPKLVGQCVLKYHELGDHQYMPDGWFGEFDDTLGLPVEGKDPESRRLIKLFEECFSLERGNQPGLSVVVPFLDESTADYAKLLAGVVKDYYLPILQDKLVVEMKHGTEESVIIDRHWLLSDSFKEFGDRFGGDDFFAELELANWFVNQCSQPEKTTIEVEIDPQEGRGGPEWDEITVTAAQTVDTSLPTSSANTDDEVSALRQSAHTLLETEKRICAKISTHVFRKGEEKEKAHFYLVLERTDKVSGTPTFFRRVLKVSDVRSRHPSAFRALVVIPPGPLGKLLGDAENPSHTSWSSRAETFLGKYKYGNKMIKLVREAPYKFPASIRGGDEFKLDRVVLSGFFGKLPVSSAGLGTGTAKNDKDKKTKPDRVISPGHRPRLRTYELDARPEGGFVIGPSEDKDAPPPEKLVVKVAYDVAAGDPLKKYSRFDFDFQEHAEDMVTVLACNYSVSGPNELTFDNFQDDFAIEVTGFDKRRDLYIAPRATNPGPINSAQTSDQSEVIDGATT